MEKGGLIYYTQVSLLLLSYKGVGYVLIEVCAAIKN